MTKNSKGLFVILLVILSCLPFLNVKAATSATVRNQAELKEALNNESITNIILGEDIHTTEKINITREVTIDGQGHTMKYVGTFGKDGSTDNTIWSGIYILQVYKTSATIKNIKLTGGNAALLINGSNVKLEGTIDVSGNGFGGIELGQGANVTAKNHLELDDNTKLVNTTESKDKPTLWVPSDSESAILEMNGLEQTINSGAEMSLQEIVNLFTPEENPKTGDNTLIAGLMSIIGLFTIGYSTKKALK